MNKKIRIRINAMYNNTLIVRKVKTRLIRDFLSSISSYLVLVQLFNIKIQDYKTKQGV